jgi:2-C-methyl-D-erythritol 4-phosphate cytidylyltransferase
VVVPAAGRGTRFGNAENKIWAVVAGRTVLEWTLSAFQSHPVVDAIVIAGAAGELNRLRATALGFAKVLSVVEGGSTRQESVANGLNALPQNCDIVLVHDAAQSSGPILTIEFRRPLTASVFGRCRRHREYEQLHCVMHTTNWERGWRK